MISNYRKLVAAAVTIALYAIKQWLGIDLGAVGDPIVEFLLVAANPFLVWLFPNTPAEPTATTTRGS